MVVLTRVQHPPPSPSHRRDGRHTPPPAGCHHNLWAILTHPHTPTPTRTHSTPTPTHPAHKAITLPKFWKKAGALDYKPFSLTSNLCKVLEKVIKLRTMEYLTRVNSEAESQHGCRRCLSCLTNWIESYDKVYNI